MEEEQSQLTKKERNVLKKQAKMEERALEHRNRKTKRTAKWLVVVVIVILGIWWAKAASQNDDAGEVIADHIKGNAQASVTLVEYGDFQCPACAAYHPIVSQISENYGNSLKIIYKHFPLSTIHPNAQEGAQAAEAAGRQGKFWEMHDLLFERQNQWSRERNPKDQLAGYAQELGLNREQFLQDYNSKPVKTKIKQDQSEGRRAQAQATPSFYLNDNFIQPRNYSEFAQSVEQAGAVVNSIDENNQSATSTTPLEGQ